MMKSAPVSFDAARKILEKLKSRDEKIRGGVFVAPDGLLVAHNLPEPENADKVAAMATALYALGRELGHTLKLGEYGITRLESQGGEVILLSAGHYSLAIVANSGVDLTLLAGAANHLRQLMAGASP